MTTMAFGIAIYMAKSRRTYDYGMPVDVIVLLTLGLQWIYVSIFLFLTPTLENMVLGILIGKLLLPALVVIPTVFLAVLAVIQKFRK